MARICTACREDTVELLCSIRPCTASLRSSRDMEVMEGWGEARDTIRWAMEEVEAWLVWDMEEYSSNNLREQT